MGWIWNILLSCSSEEFWSDDADGPDDTCEPLENINRWIAGGKLVDLTPPTYADGAGSGMDAYLFGGGFNHLNIEGFIRLVETQNWKDRPNLQLWVKGDGATGEQRFTQVRLRSRPANETKRKAKSSARSIRKPRANRRQQSSSAPRRTQR